MGRNKDAKADAAEVSTNAQAVEATDEPTTDLEVTDAKADAAEGEDDAEIEKDLVANLDPAHCEHEGCPNYATHRVHRRRNSYATGSLVVTDFDTLNCMRHIGPASTYENYELIK